MSDELTAILSEIRYDIQNIHDDANICLDTHFNDRAKAIDLIDFHIIDRIDALLPGATDAELEKLKQCAEKAKYRLEETDRRLFKALREQIRSGNYAEGTFKKMICNYCGGDFSPPNKVGYETLDLFINGLLFHRHPPQATVEREQEMVFTSKPLQG